MQDLYEATHETVHLAVREGIEVLYVEKVVGHTHATDVSRVGGRLPMYATGVGRALLAYSAKSVLERVLHAGLQRFTETTCATPEALLVELDNTRRRGVAVDHGEYDPDISPAWQHQSSPRRAGRGDLGDRTQRPHSALGYRLRGADALGVSRAHGHEARRLPANRKGSTQP